MEREIWETLETVPFEIFILSAENWEFDLYNLLAKVFEFEILLVVIERTFSLLFERDFEDSPYELRDFTALEL